MTPEDERREAEIAMLMVAHGYDAVAALLPEVVLARELDRRRTARRYQTMAEALS